LKRKQLVRQIAAEAGRAKTPRIQSRKKNCPLAWHTPPFPRRACRWLEQGQESSANRARNAHIAELGGAAPALKGARSARFICWIPACAGMAGWALFAGCPQGFCTACEGCHLNLYNTPHVLHLHIRCHRRRPRRHRGGIGGHFQRLAA